MTTATWSSTGGSGSPRIPMACGSRRRRPGQHHRRAGWYSIGGGFIRRGRIDDALISNHEQTPASSQSPEDSGNDEAAEYGDGVPYPFVSCDGLIDLCRKHHLSIADVVWANETARRSPQEVRDRLTRIWNVMSHCIDAGCASATPTLPGGLDVPRRAPLMYRRLAANSDVLRRDRRISSALESSDSAWVALFAMSVSEENAGGGRARHRAYQRFGRHHSGRAGILLALCRVRRRRGRQTFLLTAGAVGYLFKRTPRSPERKWDAKARSASPARWRPPVWPR